jgi:transcriptional regulator with XRE-family HTH domain
MLNTRQIKAARALLGWDQARLGEAAGLSLPTIQRMEKMGVDRSSVENVTKLMAAIGAAGVIILPADETGGPGVRLRNDAVQNDVP